ncbi:hypothetical protein M8994_22735, partial [Brucella sp. 21LCYQ03]|nr:hypothetical protein [Brucella sp. 21LCYQ03]
TTKKGRASDRAAINLNVTKGVSNRAIQDYQQLSTDDYFQLYWEAVRNKNLSNGLAADVAARNASASLVTDLGINPYGANFSQPVGLDGRLQPGAQALWNDSWTDVLQRTGQRTQADLSISGGGDKHSYFISGGYLDDQGIAIGSGFKRYNVRANIDAKAREWLNAGFNFAASSA